VRGNTLILVCVFSLSLSWHSLLTSQKWKSPNQYLTKLVFFFFLKFLSLNSTWFQVKKPRVNHYNSNEGVFNFGPNVNWDHNKLSKAQKMMVHTDPSLPVTLKDSWPEDKAYTQTRVCWYDVLKECCYQR
jgi:hypothetical protein